MNSTEYDEKPEDTFADWYADCHPQCLPTIPISTEKSLDNFMAGFFRREGAKLSTMQRLRFHGLVWAGIADLFEEDAVRKQRHLKTFRRAVEGIVKSLEAVDDHLHKLSPTFQGGTITTDAFATMCHNDQVPWSSEDILRHPLLPYAVAIQDVKRFLASQCPPPESRRGGRKDIDPEVRCFAKITEAFRTVGLPIVRQRKQHDGGSVFVRDEFFKGVAIIAIGYGPSSTKYLRGRAKRLGLL
jgi:hypothetical protein